MDQIGVGQMGGAIQEWGHTGGLRVGPDGHGDKIGGAGVGPDRSGLLIVGVGTDRSMGQTGSGGGSRWEQEPDSSQGVGPDRSMGQIRG